MQGRIRGTAIFAGLLFSLCTASGLQATTVTFQQGASSYSGAVDTYLNVNLPTADNSAANPLIVDGANAVAPFDERHILLRFDSIFGNGAGQIPLGATINSATLTINITDPSDSGASLHRMLQTWNATDNWNTWGNGIQANNVEAASATDISGLLNSTGTFNLDVTVSVAAWAAGASNFGWAWLNNGTNSWQFSSSEDGTVANRPKLSVTFNQGGGSANLVRQPYLQLGTPSSMTVVWRSDVATDSRVRYGTTQGSLNLSATNASVSVDHIVTINGLSAGTKYFYDIGSTSASYGGGTASHYFRTSPTVGSTGAFRFWAVGDSGTGSSTQTAVMNAMLTAAGATPPNFAVHLGDIAYNSGTEQEFTDNHFTPFNTVLRNTVMWPSLGNHEAASVNTSLQTGPYYAAHVLPSSGQAGGIASGTEAYYSFDYANAHFVVLDSMDSSRAPGGPMFTWLANDLAATTQQWLIAYWHHPPYSKGSHDSDSDIQLAEMRERALPILEAGGVDLVLSGHSHAYERSYLVDRAYGYGSSPNFPTPSFATLNGSGKILDDGNGRPAPGGTGEYRKSSGLNPHLGTVYVVAGHGAQSGGGTINHPVMYFSELNHGSCLIDINNSELTLQNVRETGTISDTFKIIKGAVPPRIVSTTPNRSSVLSMLPSVAVTFSRSVTGVVAGGLTVNGSAATSVSGSGAGPYTFTGYAAPGNGAISVVLAAGGITDSGPPNLPFAGDSWNYTIDTTPPHLVAESPTRNSTTTILSTVSVTFSKPVTGVAAANMTVNGSPATALSGVSGTVGPYVFSGYAAPAEGNVSVILASGSIVEVGGLAQPFAGDSWSYILHATLVINEFLSSNNTIIADEFGDFDDWLEIYNPGSTTVDMGGMFLTDDLDAPTQYQIPAGVTIPAGGYLIFWCDTTPGQGPRHTNFNISKSGEDLGLFDKLSNGNQLIDGFTFAAQTTDISAGRFPNGSGPIVTLSSPTPGATNGGPPPSAPPLPIIHGDTFKYFKGTAAPPSQWNQVNFDDNAWLSGASGFGYGDSDDATNLPDMQQITGTQPGYASVFVRRLFSIPNPGAVTSLTLTMDYDDGYVAYLNGVEVSRSASMGGTVGTPPAFSDLATGSHEASGGSPPSVPPVDTVNLNGFINQLVAGNNVLAIQCHNNTLASTDLSLIPTLTATTAQCSGAGDCNDNNPCTIDTCNSGTCVHTPVSCPSGQTCNQSTGQCEAAPTTVSFQQGTSGYSSAKDTYLDAGAATTSHATTTPLIVDLAPSVNQVLMRFDNIFGNGAGLIPAGSTITSATLTINVTNISAFGATLHRMTQTWSDGDTWNTFSTGGAGIQAGTECLSSSDASGFSNSLGLYTLDVTSSLSAWSTNPAANFGWAWLPPSQDDSWQFDSAEGATVANRPKLSVTYTSAPPCQNNGDCNDNNACTTDVCNAGTCTHTPISCDDGNACTTDTCDSVLGCQHTAVNCDDGNPCTVDSCDSVLGCQHVLVSCSPGQACNSGNGQCEAGATLPIAIGNTWKYFKGTVDPGSTWPQLTYNDSAWLSGPSGFGYGDNDDATILGDMINNYAAVFIRKKFIVQNPAAITALTLTIDYDDGYVAYLNGQEVARSTSMGGTVGVRPAFNALAPTGHEASGGDAGSSPQPPEVTHPSISLLQAGINVLSIECHNNTLGSSDLSLIPSLTGTFQCLSASDCNDSNACTDDSCVAGACQHTPTNCNDNNACTTDACNTGTGCTHTAINCDDGNPCTIDTCDALNGCQHTPVTNGTPCPDGNLCNGDETCQNGICTAGTPPTCDDNNPCTVDSCSPATGCQHTPVTNGTPCPNGTVCDGAETCQGGTCTAGTPLACNDGVFCNGTETCDPQTGCHAGTPPCQAGEQCDEAADRCRHPRMTCQLGATQTTANSTVPLTVFLEDVMNVRGYQCTIAITRTQGAGTVSVACPGGVSIAENRPDYVFAGLGTTYPITNCPARKAASALLSGGAIVNGSAYLASYTLTVSADATSGSTFDVAILTTPDSALTDSGNSPIAFTVSPACTLSISAPTTGTLTVNLDVPGLTGGVANGQIVAQRTVEFSATSCPGPADVRTLPVTFHRQGGSGTAQVVLTNLDPATQWLSVREGHTLRRRVPVDFSGDYQDTVSVSLKSGDLQTTGVPQDDLVDITDFAILAARWNSSVNDCASGNPQDCSLGADVTGDGIQETADFQAIQFYFFETSDAANGCRPDGTGHKPTPKLRISLDELKSRIPDVNRADLNGDSQIDSNDLRAFAKQHRLQLTPTFELKLQNLEKRGKELSQGAPLND